MFEKMKGLSFKEKVEYYFQYYGWATLGVIIGIIFLVSVVKLVVKNVTTRTAATIVVLDADDSNQLTDYDSYLSSLVEEQGLNVKKDQIETYSGLYVDSSADAQTLYATQIKLQAYMQAGECDVMLIDEANWDSDSWKNLKELYICADLSDYLSEDVLKAHEEDILYCTDEETGEEYPAGIYTDADSELMQDGGWYQNCRSIVMIGSGTKNEEMATEIVMKALGE